MFENKFQTKQENLKGFSNHNKKTLKNNSIIQKTQFNNKKAAVKLQASVINEEIIYIKVSPEFNYNSFITK